MVVQEQEWFYRIRHYFRQRGRDLNDRLDWVSVQLLVRDPLVERCALGLLALITALLLFRARFPVEQIPWIGAIDAHQLARSAGAYGVFFVIWFSSLLTHTMFCPTPIREHGSLYRAMESFRKATDLDGEAREALLYGELLDIENGGRPLARFFITGLLLSSLACFVASLVFLTLAMLPVLD